MSLSGAWRERWADWRTDRVIRSAKRNTKARLLRAVHALRCPHGGGLVYDAHCRATGQQITFSRCDCGHIHLWFEDGAETQRAASACSESRPGVGADPDRTGSGDRR